MHDSNDSAQRRLLIVTGDPAAGRDWVTSRLDAASPSLDDDEVLWLAAQAPPCRVGVAPGAVAQRLGSECRLLVVDLHQGLHPDDFAAAVGTLRGGGDCVVLAPPLEDWAAFDDPDRQRFAAYPHTGSDMRGLFLARLARLWSADPAVSVVTTDTRTGLRVAPAEPAGGTVTLKPDQQRIAALIDSVAHGHARRPLVLTADRGRGKSTLLGVCAARLLLAGCARITLVAPARAAVATLYRHVRQAAGLDADSGVPAELAVGAGRLCFRLPSEWRDEDAAASSLVIVDEAAAIPVAQLERLLQAANRLVFASTVHGYEGSGRGFALRFRESLDRLMPQWRAAQLETPVRWAAGDPLEDLLNNALLLDVELPAAGADTSLGQVSVQRVDPVALADDEAGLREVFALLVNAHYQTRPSDLRQLLDNPDITLWLAHAGDAVVGVLLGVAEGGFDAAMAADVIAGRRRPRGHLLPQSLAVHAGVHDCLTRRVLRVQRIAVDPRRRRRGIGSRLLAAAGKDAHDAGFDLVACAYGIEPGLLGFWQHAGFLPARLGVRIDPASATRSLFMLRGLNPAGDDLAVDAASRFRADLPWALGGPLHDFDSRLAAALLGGRDCSDLALADAELQALAAIAAGARQSSTAVAAAWKAVVCLAASVRQGDDGLAALVAWQLQHRPVEQVCRRFRLAGRAALAGLLRERLSALLQPVARDG